jgi:hypothetical protein
MPKLQEAAVAVAGTIVDVQDSTEFGSDKKDGVRVLVATLDGFASVKLKTETANELRPTAGRPVAWIIRPGASGGNGRDASTFTMFVRALDSLFLDKLVSAFNAANAAPAAQPKAA